LRGFLFPDLPNGITQHYDIFNLQNSKSHSLGDQIQFLKFSFEQIEETKDEQVILLMTEQFNWSPPLISVVLSASLDRPNVYVSVQDDYTYLNTIRFPRGLSFQTEQECIDTLEKFSGKSYLPIIKFSTASHDSTNRNHILTHIGKMIRTITKIPVNYYTAVSYLVGELTDNIVEHSKSKHGFISFQHYQYEGFFDICICDNGRGMLQSYKEYIGEKDFTYVINYKDAINCALQGNSTKSKERGFGVHTSVRMIIDGLGGNVLISSGNALFCRQYHC
jgi:hypothetical protein